MSYIGIFKMQFKGELQYRAKALSGIVTQFFWGLMYIYLYSAFMKGGIDNFSISQMSSYIWLGQAFFAMRYIGIPKNAGTDIVSGNVCYKYVRPINIYNQWYAEYLGEKVAATLLRFSPITIVALIVGPKFGLSLPVSFVAFLLFILSLFIGCVMCVAISMFSVFLTMKTLSERGASTLVLAVAGLLGGMYIPIPLMPKIVQSVLNFLPFRYISDLPFRIYIGNIGVADGLIQIGISLAWLIIVVVVGKLLINSHLKKTVIQGG